MIMGSLPHIVEDCMGVLQLYSDGTVHRAHPIHFPFPPAVDDASVAFQTAELGKVDVGGGGTIAYICALYGMEVIDSGVPVLSMHAPWEIINKADLFEAVKGYRAFMLNA